MGTVNHIYNAVAKDFPEIALQWAKACYVQGENYHSGSYNGNACRKLLKKVDALEAYSHIEICKFVQVLHYFDHVVTSCFGNNLGVNYRNCIEKFKNSYMDSGLSITPKVCYV